MDFEFVINTVLAFLGIALFFVGRREGKRSERAIVSGGPGRTAGIMESVLWPVLEDAYGAKSLRGWRSEARARVGYADLRDDDGPPYDLLVEYPSGAHSTILVVLDEDLETGAIRLVGHLHNGVGHKFFVGTGGARTEIGTVDYVRPLPAGRPLSDAPMQAVYYALEEEQLTEVGRGEPWDPRVQVEPPPSARPLLGRSWELSAASDQESA